MNYKVLFFAWLGCCVICNNAKAQQRSGTSSDCLESGFVKEKNGDFDGAIADFNLAIKLVPKGEYAALACYGIGFALFSQGRTDEAIANYSLAIDLWPKFSDAYYMRGFAEATKRAWDQATADLNRAIGLDPKGSQAARDTLAQIKEARGWDVIDSKK